MSATDIAFERITVRDLPDAFQLARANTEPRVASYAMDPPGARRRAKLRALLSTVPWLGDRLTTADQSYWILSRGVRNGVLLLGSHESWLHLHFVVIDRALQGTGAASRVLDFVDECAKRTGAAGVDLYVDRRNYRALHAYLRHGFTLTPDRRFVFEARRSSLPSWRAVTTLPWHLGAELLGTLGGKRLRARRSQPGGAVSVVAREGRVVAVQVDDTTDLDEIVACVFRDTLAETVRVATPAAVNLKDGRLVAVLQRMQKVAAP